MTQRWGGRPVRAGVLVMAVGLTAACAGTAVGPVPGAPAHPGQFTGPTVVATPPLPNLVARVTESRANPGPVKSAGLLKLTLAITDAVTSQATANPAVDVAQKAAAANQVFIQWTVSRDTPDPGAKVRVRADAIKILRIVQTSGLKYGSVLLVAKGAVILHGKKKTTVVVRAKYTHPLVAGTDWRKVSLGAIFKLPDDKPAVITPSYR